MKNKKENKKKEKREKKKQQTAEKRRWRNNSQSKIHAYIMRNHKEWLKINEKHKEILTKVNATYRPRQMDKNNPKK